MNFATQSLLGFAMRIAFKPVLAKGGVCAADGAFIGPSPRLDRLIGQQRLD